MDILAFFSVVGEEERDGGRALSEPIERRRVALGVEGGELADLDWKRGIDAIPVPREHFIADPRHQPALIQHLAAVRDRRLVSVDRDDLPQRRLLVVLALRLPAT